MLTRGKLLLVAVEVNFPLHQLALLRRQLLSGKPLLLFNFGLLEEEGLLRFGELLPLLCQGPESFLVETPELLRALLDVRSRLHDKRLAGFQLGLPRVVERQQLPQQPLLLRLAAAAAWRVDQRQPSGGEHLSIEALSLDRRPGA